MSKDEPVNVLLVDDQPGKLLSYQVMLEELGENLISASSAKEALAFLLKSEVAVILVDVCMPELDGFELAKMIREHPRFQKTAIIFISAIHMSESDYLRGYEAGAVDYLSVPVVPELLRAKVRVFAELFRKTRQLHQLNEELESRVAERTNALNNSAGQLRSSEQGEAWRWPRAIWAPGIAILPATPGTGTRAKAGYSVSIMPASRPPSKKWKNASSRGYRHLPESHPGPVPGEKLV